MPRALSLPSLSGIWRVGQSAKTPPFHGGMTGSTPVRATRSPDFIGAFSIYNMIEVYVIESLTDATWYTGIALNAIKRLKEHNHGKNRFTKGHLPWKIIYTESLPDWTSARVREKYLKTASGKNWLQKYLVSRRNDEGSPPA